MANAGDVIDEFKHAKPPEKAVIIGVIVLVVGIAIYWRSKIASSATTTTTVGNGGPTASSGGGSASTLPSVNTSNGQVPILPSGTNPVYSPGGNLVGYQQGGGSSPTATTSPTPTLTTTMTRGLWKGQTDSNGAGGVPIWQNPNANWAQSAGGIPLNQQVQVGASVPGNYFGKAATYYPVTYNGTSGYVGSWDLASAPQQQGSATSTKLFRSNRQQTQLAKTYTRKTI